MWKTVVRVPASVIVGLQLFGGCWKLQRGAVPRGYPRPDVTVTCISCLGPHAHLSWHLGFDSGLQFSKIERPLIIHWGEAQAVGIQR